MPEILSPKRAASGRGRIKSGKRRGCVKDWSGKNQPVQKQRNRYKIRRGRNARRLFRRAISAARHNIPDEGENRSTVFMLEKLRQANALSKEDFQNFADGYEFLSELDHNLR
jgi:hypothetical protein